MQKFQIKNRVKGWLKVIGKVIVDFVAQYRARKKTSKAKSLPKQKHPPELIKEEGAVITPKEKQLEPRTKSGFLICPIKDSDEFGKPLTPHTARISAVLDHSGTAIDPNSNKHWGKNAKDQKVRAFNEEVGEGIQCLQEPCGYPRKSGGEFFQNNEINYVGVSYDGGKNTLQYDGHAGYDFPYPKQTPIVAPADGNLYKAAQGKDLIYGANWNTDGSFYIVHKNGFVTWFRHCEKLANSFEAQISNNFMQFCIVKQGDVVAYVGNKGTRPVHLHFEVRNKDGKIVDPYLDKLWIT